MFAKSNYSILPSSPTERKSSELDEAQQCLVDDDFYASKIRKNTLQSYAHWCVHAISLCALSILLYTVINTPAKSRQECWDMFNYYSPVNDAVVPYDYVPYQFNGSLWQESGFEGPPTPEVEDRWHSIMEFGMIAVSEEDIRRVKHEDWSAQFPPEVGGGYIAATIGAHQIHCLHYLWQDHYIDYVPVMQDKKRRVPEMYERHYEHCTQYIRQTLMCQFDTGIMPYNWVLDHAKPTPNGNTHHKCVNWDRLQEWLSARAVPMPDDFKWHQPADAHSLDYNP